MAETFDDVLRDAATYIPNEVPLSRIKGLMRRAHNVGLLTGVNTAAGVDALAINGGTVGFPSRISAKSITGRLDALEQKRTEVDVVLGSHADISNRRREQLNALEGEVTNMCPSSILQEHSNCSIFLDENSGSLLSKK